MSRRYADSVDVRRHDDVPVEFRWRDRTYGVTEVLAHWVEAGGWWRRSTPGHDAGPGPGQGGGALDDEEREFWRVEAGGAEARPDGPTRGAEARPDGPTRGAEARLSGPTRGVFDLCFNWSSGQWSLARAWD